MAGGSRDTLPKKLQAEAERQMQAFERLEHRRLPTSVPSSIRRPSGR